MKNTAKKRKQHLKKLAERTEMQAYNQSLFSATAYRHGRKDFASHNGEFHSIQKIRGK